MSAPLINWSDYLSASTFLAIFDSFMGLVPIILPVVLAFMGFSVGWKFFRGQVR
jgi:hypothetical protein